MDELSPDEMMHFLEHELQVQLDPKALRRAEDVAKAIRTIRENLWSEDMALVIGAYLDNLFQRGFLLLEPNNVQMPRTLDEAKAMNLLSENYLKGKT